ncbi:hypothetical protein M378DRAFT_85285 [Amanita muscaria Koide BX008]|uniref:Uncharacterized protein n=1 Tax=Amanita muscaria (strain Koide BX008) TaxID=946122 RepID=A0A0C2SYS9_AMAMK|nr:hypothetical protein M378DRAFT_85285 [Amanita muscaria Koide BX008]
MWGAELPFDILGSIFLLCIDNRQFIVPQSFSGSRVPVDPRIVLSCVCSYWRSVALRTSALWRDILLELDSPQVIFVANQVLPRAQGRPLRLAARRSRFQNRAPPNPSPEDFINTIIVPYAQHLKALELFVPFPLIKPILALIHKVRFPALEVLSLRQASVGTITSFSVDTTSPPINVKTLELDVRWSKPLLENSVGLPLGMAPWSQLTTFVNLNAMPIRTFAGILSLCPLLESCAVYLEFFNGPPWFPQITAAFLERLHIRFTHTTWWDQFLKESFSLPSIRDLALKVDKEGLGWTSELNDFLCNQCGSQLERLYVASRENRYVFDTGLRNFESFLQKHAFSLRQLYLPMFTQTIIFDVESIRRLVSRELCPCLERLWLENLNWPPSLDRLSAVAEGVKDSMNSTRGALRELHVICYYHHLVNRPVEKAMNAMIQEFSSTGIKFRVSHFDYKNFNLATQEKDWFGYLV